MFVPVSREMIGDYDIDVKLPRKTLSTLASNQEIRDYNWPMQHFTISRK